MNDDDQNRLKQHFLKVSDNNQTFSLWMLFVLLHNTIGFYYY